MHPLAARLIGIAISGSTLACTHRVCAPAKTSEDRSFAEIGETAPDVVAEAYAASGLSGGNYSPSAAQCRRACGERSVGCEATVAYRGEPDSPRASYSKVVCRFPPRTQCHDVEGDPFGMSSCPYGCGRRPAFVALGPIEDHDPFRAQVAEIARLEALSVGAFAQLAADARRHELGPDLLGRIEAARRDERRHARLAHVLLRELGARPVRLPRVPMRARTLEEIAIDNVVEGCVREAFGAVVACMQPAPRLAAFHEAIAEDELAHAALAFDLYRVLKARLSPEAQGRVAAARDRALVSLLDDVDARLLPVARSFGALLYEEAA